MKQTAVEWLVDNLISEPWSEEHFKHNAECWDKAEKMEKEHLCYFYVKGAEAEINNPYVSNIEFYNETFK